MIRIANGRAASKAGLVDGCRHRRWPRAASDEGMDKGYLTQGIITSILFPLLLIAEEGGVSEMAWFTLRGRAHRAIDNQA